MSDIKLLEDKIKAEAEEYCRNESYDINRDDCSYCEKDYLAGRTKAIEREKKLEAALREIQNYKVDEDHDFIIAASRFIQFVNDTINKALTQSKEK